MKKTFTINISGTIFHIEEDAYEKLQGYFIKLKNHFGNSQEGKEIIADIEGRVAELFLEKTKGDNKVITLELIEEVIAIMGTPEDFMDQEANEEPVSGMAKGKRRLYRSPDKRVIAGVCGGLGAYFKMDPVVLRILFVILFFVNGVGLIAYIIFWIAVPKAKTTSQRLEMRGESVTVSNIERTLRDQGQDENPSAESSRPTSEKDQLSDNKSNLESDYPYKRREKESDISSQIGKTLLRTLAVIFGVFFITTGFLGLIALISTAIVGQSLVGSWPLVWSPDFHITHILGHFVSPEALTTGIVALAVLVGIPFLAIFFIGSKMVFSYKTNNAAIGLGMVGIWLIALVALLVVSAGEARNYQSQTTLTNSETIQCDPCPTLYIRLAEDKYSGYAESEWNLDRFRVVQADGKNVLLGQPKFDIEKSATEDIVLIFRKKSKGRDHADANQTIQEMSYHYELRDSVIILNPWFLTGGENKWRDQKLDIILRIPEGKSVFLDNELVNIIYDIENVSNTWDREMVGKYWEMKPEGLTMKETAVSAGPANTN